MDAETNVSYKVIGPKACREEFQKLGAEAGIEMKLMRPPMQLGRVYNHIDFLRIVFSKEAVVMFSALCSVITTWLAKRPVRKVSLTLLIDGRIKVIDASGYSKDELKEILPHVQDILLYDKPDDDERKKPESEAVQIAPPLPNTIRVFLCHGKEDKAEVRKLYKEIKARGMAPWLDEEDLPPGIEWEPAIQKAVRDSDVVIVCLSKKSTSKTGFVQKEIKIALDAADLKPEGMIYIIPVMIEECVLPSRLSKWQAVSLFEPNGLAKLMRGLEGHPNRKNADAKEAGQKPLANNEDSRALLMQNEVLLAELNEQNEKTKLKAPQPEFLEILNYIIDENRTKGFRNIIERCIGPVASAVPLVEQSDTFDEFMENAGIKLDITDKIKAPSEYPNMTGHQQFGVPKQDNPFGTDMANFTIEGDHTVHMNGAAHRHFDWSFITFKKQYETKFHTTKGRSLSQESSKAAAAIHEKYNDVLNSYPDCIFPLVGIDDTEEKYNLRLLSFQSALSKLSREMQSKEVFIVRKDKLRNLHKIIGLISDYVNLNQRFEMQVRSMAKWRLSPEPGETESAERIHKEITKTEGEIHLLEPLVNRDFAYLIT